MPSKTTTKVKQARLRSGLTLRDLAEVCRAAGVSVSDSQLSKIERGVCEPRPALRKVLAAVLNLSPLAFERDAA